MDEKRKLFFIFVSVIVVFLIGVFLYNSQKTRKAVGVDSRQEDIWDQDADINIEETAEESSDFEDSQGSLLDRLETAGALFEEEEEEVVSEEDIDGETEAKGILDKLQKRQEEFTKEEPLAVRVFKVKTVKYEDSLPVTGDVKSIKEIKMRFEKEGIIEDIKVKEGDIVKKDELIATLNKKDSLLAVARAQSKVNSDAAALAAAEKELEITQILFNKGAIIETKLDEVKFRIESERSKARVSEEELKMAESALKKTEMRAPIDGIVGAREAEVGEFFTPRDIVINLLGLKELYAEIGIVERDIHKVAIGQEAIVKVDAYPNKQFKGKIGNLYPVVEGRSRTMKAEVNIVDEDQLLLPGMFAQVEILLADFDSVLMVPTMSLLQITPDAVIIPLVLLEPGVGSKDIEMGEARGKIKLVAVEVGYVGPDYTQILSGIKESDCIVLEAHGEIENDRSVRILGMEEYGINE